MKKLLFVFFIFPIVSQELMINSFDSQSDFDEDYWIMDLTGDDEIGYANYSESSINHDGLGAIRLDARNLLRQSFKFLWTIRLLF